MFDFAGMRTWESHTGIVRFLAGISLVAAHASYAQDWQPYTGVNKLRSLMADTVLEGTLTGDVKATARYNSDGTGVLEAWGDAFPRTWTVRGEDQLCIEVGREEHCVRVEKAAGDDKLFRATDVATGESAIFSLGEQGAATREETEAGDGGAAEPSAEEIAKSLANPNTPLASQTFKFQYRTFDGDLPGADDQSGTMVLYQPSFPFALDNGATVFFRPAFPILFDQPVFDAAEGDFDSANGLGDIGFDLAYGRTTQNGVLWAVGMVSTLPTATEDELGPDRWNLGPELLLGKLTSKYVLGALVTYQTDIAGSGDADISLTTINAFGTVLPGGGWSVGSAPIISYDHEDSDWTVPLNLSVGKTVIWNGRPWKLGIEVNHYVEQPEAFGPEWMIGINVAPVVENMFAQFF